MERLQTIFAEPTLAAIHRSMTIDPATGRMTPKNPTPRWVGHGQQLAAKRLAERVTQVGSLPPARLSRQHRRWLERKGRR